jgi:putative hydrolase of the HAD superfamily
MSELKAVVFDMDGTLLEWQDHTVSFEQLALTQFGAAHRILAVRGHRVPDVHDFSSTLYAKAAAGWREAMSTQQSYTVRDLLEATLPGLGLPVTEDDLAACVEAFESVAEPIGPKDDALTTLVALRDMGLRLGLISNSWSTPACRDDQLLRAGVLDLLAVRVYSSDMEVMKPHPAIFQRALRELGVTAAQAVMVGDTLEADIGGAQDAGMRAVWLDTRDQDLPEGTSVRPDAHIQRLAELVQVLEQWMGS